MLRRVFRTQLKIYDDTFLIFFYEKRYFIETLHAYGLTTKLNFFHVLIIF